MLSWPFSSGKQQSPCIPTPITTSASQASFCAAVMHRHPHHTSRPAQNSSEAMVVSGFHQASTQGTPSRHMKPVPELASLQHCLSKPRSGLHECARVLQPSFQTTANALQEGYGRWPEGSLAKRNPTCNLAARRRMGQAHPATISPLLDFEGWISCFFFVKTIVSKSK